MRQHLLVRPVALAVGRESVSRSSSDGCSRSRPLRPDMSGGAGRLPARRGRVRIASLRTSISAVSSASVDQHALADRERPVRRASRPFRLARQRERRVGRSRRAGIAGRDEADRLAVVGPGEAGGHPDLVAQVGRRLDRSSALDARRTESRYSCLRPTPRASGRAAGRRRRSSRTRVAVDRRPASPAPLRRRRRAAAPPRSGWPAASSRLASISSGTQSPGSPNTVGERSPRRPSLAASRSGWRPGRCCAIGCARGIELRRRP